MEQSDPEIAGHDNAIEVGSWFLKGYYAVVTNQPHLANQFYTNNSTVVRLDCVTSLFSFGETVEVINDMMMSMNVSKVDVETENYSELWGGAIKIQVTGLVQLKGYPVRKRFAHCIVLAPEKGGYSIFGDIFKLICDEYDDSDQVASYTMAETGIHFNDLLDGEPKIHETVAPAENHVQHQDPLEYKAGNVIYDETHSEEHITSFPSSTDVKRDSPLAPPHPPSSPTLEELVKEAPKTYTSVFRTKMKAMMATAESHQAQELAKHPQSAPVQEKSNLDNHQAVSAPEDQGKGVTASKSDTYMALSPSTPSGGTASPRVTRDRISPTHRPSKRHRRKSMPPTPRCTPRPNKRSSSRSPRSSSSPPKAKRDLEPSDEDCKASTVVSDPGPVAIFWDMENCAVPKDFVPEIISRNIRSALKKHHLLSGPIKIFSAYADCTGVPTEVREGCQRTGVNLLDVPKGRKESVDKAILADILFFALDHLPPSCVMLISGDQDYARMLHRLAMRGYTVVLAVPNHDKVSPLLINAGDFVWEWPCLAQDGTVITRSAVHHQPTEEETMQSRWFHPGDLEGLRLQMEHLLRLNKCELPLSEIIPKYQKVFKKQLLIKDYQARKLVDIFKMLGEKFRVNGQGKSKTVLFFEYADSAICSLGSPVVFLQEQLTDHDRVISSAHGGVTDYLGAGIAGSSPPDPWSA